MSRQIPVLQEARPRLPAWFKVELRQGPDYQEIRRLTWGLNLHTICEEARCPNVWECWNNRTATFLILGDICTRRCHYCAVTTGRPLPLDEAEPERVAAAVKKLGLRHAVITAVNRDELPDGGARIFAETIRAIRRELPTCTIEVLIPDFLGDLAALETVLAAKPDILNHNIETVPRLFPSVRPQGKYQRSIAMLEAAASRGAVTKSGLMVGLGETVEEVRTVMRELRAAGCAELPHDRAHLFHCFAQTNHEPGLGDGPAAGRRLEHRDRPLVLPLRPYRREQARDRLDVVVENVGPGCQDCLQCGEVAEKIRNEDFDRAGRQFPPDGPDRLGEDPRAAVGQFIAVDRRDHGMAESELLHRRRHPFGLRFIQRQGPAGSHRTVVAPTRADVAEDQERGRPVVPALPDVWAPRLFADRVEVQFPGEPPDLLIVRPLAQFHLEPRRQARPRLLDHGNGAAHRAFARSSACLNVWRNCAATAPSITR